MTEQKTAAANCVSCGQVLTGKYCSNCGERVLKAEDKTLAHFFEEFIHVLTHADSKFLKSLKYLFTRPGFLTREHISGRRKAYTSPLTLFLIGNLIYLLVLPVDTLNSKYISQTQGQNYSRVVLPIAKAKMREKGWTETQMEEHYNATSAKISKLLLIVFVILVSVPVTILFYRRDAFYYDHLVFATEFVNFGIYFLMMVLPYVSFAVFMLLKKFLHLNIDYDVNSEAATWLLFLVIWTYLALAARRVYEDSWVIPKTFLLTLGVGYGIILYRFLQFHITMWLL
jgi:hypothetical protein